MIWGGLEYRVDRWGFIWGDKFVRLSDTGW